MAEKQFNEAIKLKPNSAETLLNIGNIFEAKGDEARAERQYRDAMRTNPCCSNAFNNLGISSGLKARPVLRIRPYQHWHIIGI